MCVQAPGNSCCDGCSRGWGIIRGHFNRRRPIKMRDQLNHYRGDRHGFQPRVEQSTEGGDPRQRHPGARVRRYRCSLPGLTGLTACRRGGTDAGHPRNWRRGRDCKARPWALPFGLPTVAPICCPADWSNPLLGFSSIFSSTSPSSPAGAAWGSGGEGGIRTLGTGLPHTRFPGVLLRPLGHLSKTNCSPSFGSAWHCEREGLLGPSMGRALRAPCGRANLLSCRLVEPSVRPL